MLNLYKMDPRIYDEYMSTKIEGRNFAKVAGIVAEMARSRPEEDFSVLDMGCGTALLYRKWLSEIENLTYTGVDINERFLEFASERCGPGARFILGDAVSVDAGGPFCAAVATSIYHHIEDENDRKGEFPRNVCRHVTGGGDAVIYEKLVSPFSDDREAARAGTVFYMERIEDIMKEEKLSDTQKFALYNELYLTSVRKDEYKVDYKRLMKDFSTAGMRLEREIKMWPPDGRFGDYRVGDFIFVFKRPL
jgi:SAM-dependent methyltransferase